MIEDIIDEVAELTGITAERIVSRQLAQDVCAARRRVILRAFDAGWHPIDIADIIGRSPSTVRQIISSRRQS